VFTEGPVGTADGGLYFSDLQAGDKDLSHGPERQNFGLSQSHERTNGLALTRDGTLVGAEGDGKRISKVGPGGATATRTAGIAGIAPDGANDLIVDSKGGLYFTDPGPRPLSRVAKPTSITARRRRRAPHRRRSNHAA